MYLNEIDPHAAQWLGQLFPNAIVDQRSIADVRPSDISVHGRCHFFAGIGGWELALRLAGWPADREVWTGSCPCQPYSAAGKGQGDKDPRNLWPEFFRLIRECHPATVIGEQVEAAIRFGWLDRVFADLEGEGYACGAIVLGAHSIGAPHIRQRLFWVADAGRTGDERRRESGIVSGESGDTEDQARERKRGGDATGNCGTVGGLADATGDVGERRQHKPERRPQGRAIDRGAGAGPGRSTDTTGVRCLNCGKPHASGTRFCAFDCAAEYITNHFGGLADAAESRHAGARQGAATDRDGADCLPQRGLTFDEPAGSGAALRLADAERAGQQGRTDSHIPGEGRGREGRKLVEPRPVEHTGWSDFDIVHCRDGKSRRIERGTFPLVARLPRGVVHSGDPSAPINAQATAEARTMRLKGYGNAIVPQLAAEFIRAFLETEHLPSPGNDISDLIALLMGE